MADRPGAPSFLVRLYGHQWSECGYCRGQRAAIVQRDPSACSRAFHIVVSNELHPAAYEEFVNRGWRRCGVSVYKPDNWVSCCPQLSIRLPVQSFVPSKSQRKVLKKMEAALRRPIAEPRKPSDKRRDQRPPTVSPDVLKSLAQDLRSVLSGILTDQFDLDSLTEIPFKPRKSTIYPPGVVVLSTPICAVIAGKSQGRIDRSSLCTQAANELARQVSPDEEASPTKKSRVNGGGRVVKVEPHVQSGQILVHLTAPESGGVSTHEAAMTTATTTSPTDADPVDRLAQWWARRQPSQSLARDRRITLTTLPAHESAMDPDVYRLYAHYQHLVHGDEDPFRENLMQSDDDDNNNNGDASSDPWEDDWGQRAPRGWKASVRQVWRETFASLPPSQQHKLARHFVQFYEFLVENPFPRENRNSGTLHQQYRVNGVLIAVGVVDVLPQGLSSVYVFYDADFSHSVAPLGKYTSLREIAWAKDNGLPYYYLGYYIHSCVKMRYKADYAPSDLLCPRTARWVSAAQGKRLIDEKSPERHCCPLVAEGMLAAELADQVDESISPHLQLEVGLPRVVQWQELPEEATTVLRPFVGDFCREAGPWLSSHVVMDFRNA